MEPIEEHADAILARAPGYVWDGERLPVPIEDIVDSVFGLLIRDVEDMTTAPGAPDLPPGQSLSGLLLPARGEIWVNADEARRWPPRRRFTIGHELGHWELHRPTSQQTLFCRSTSVTEGEASTQPAPRAPGQGEPAPSAAHEPVAPGVRPPRSSPARPPAPQPGRDTAAIEDEANAFAAALLMPRWAFVREHTRCGGDIPTLCATFGTSEKAARRRVAAVFG